MAGPATPVLDEMQAQQPETQIVGEFLEWLQEQDIELCKRGDRDPYRLYSLSDNTETILAKWKGIDLRAAEAERVALLEYHSRQRFSS